MNRKIDFIYIWFLVMISLLVYLIYIGWCEIEKKINTTAPEPPKIDTIYISPDTFLNKAVLYKELKRSGVINPKVVFCQSMIETGHLKSRVCLDKNNLFGMHNPTQRRTLTIANKGEKYAAFFHWRHAVKDLLLWQRYHYLHKAGLTDQQYINFLRPSGYIAGSAPEYESILKKILKAHEKSGFFEKN